GASLLAALLEGTVDDALSGGLLAVDQDLVDQLGDEDVAVHRVLDEWALCYWTFTWHGLLLLLDAVAGTCLLTVLVTLCVQRSPHALGADARQGLARSFAGAGPGVFWGFVARLRHLAGDLVARGQADAGDPPRGGVLALSGGGVATA